MRFRKVRKLRPLQKTWINPKTCGILKILLKTFKLSQSQKHHSIEFKNLINSYLMDIHLKKI